LTGAHCRVVSYRRFEGAECADFRRRCGYEALVRLAQLSLGLEQGTISSRHLFLDGDLTSAHRDNGKVIMRVGWVVKFWAVADLTDEEVKDYFARGGKKGNVLNSLDIDANNPKSLNDLQPDGGGALAAKFVKLTVRAGDYIYNPARRWHQVDSPVKGTVATAIELCPRAVVG
jgi:hypothetical protein